MHSVFCATPRELEAERSRFYDLVGQFNETFAMQKGILFVPVTLTNVLDKRPFQHAVNRNIRDSRHYILILWDDWGPKERNFRNDYHLALQSAADPSLPMHSVAVLAKKQPSGQPPADGMPESQAAFSTLAEFDECIGNLLSAWLETLLTEEQQARAATV